MTWFRRLTKRLSDLVFTTITNVALLILVLHNCCKIEGGLVRRALSPETGRVSWGRISIAQISQHGRCRVKRRGCVAKANDDRVTASESFTQSPA
jgi:hypothetical protein